MEKPEYETMAAVELRHWWYGGMRAVSAALLDPLYAGRRHLRVLDAGCGTGGDAMFLRRYGDVVALDYAAEAAPIWCMAAIQPNIRAAFSSPKDLPASWTVGGTVAIQSRP